MTQADIKRMLMFVAKTFKQPILEEIVDAESDNALSVRITNTPSSSFDIY